jgi:hypothetical protein
VSGKKHNEVLTIYLIFILEEAKRVVPDVASEVDARPKLVDQPCNRRWTSNLNVLDAPVPFVRLEELMPEEELAVEYASSADTVKERCLPRS